MSTPKTLSEVLKVYCSPAAADEACMRYGATHAVFVDDKAKGFWIAVDFEWGYFDVHFDPTPVESGS